MLDANPLKALQYAFAAGELSAGDLAARLQDDKNRQTEEEWRHIDRDRVERMDRLNWESEARLRAENLAREDQRIVRGIKVEVLRELVKRGHLDMVDLDSLTSEILGELRVGDSESTGELPGSSDQKPEPAEDEEPSVREEDDD
jgi:hypothetical protein